ncbi:iron complex outermembrane receptor protein [Sphingobium xanthum]|uniref:TonB-dependent receptor n=1 Tax=Sphingobium xanthum TaxID=1387165 RepID=UPI001C8B3F35|nr:TonB-dependent receptor [Sphingobium xanthum]
MRRGFLYAGASFAFVLSGTAAQAQSADQSEDDTAEIVVTANRRVQNIQDVAMSVSQFSGDDLTKAGATDSTDLAQLVPGVYVAGAFGGQSQQYTIRGVTQSDYLDTIENPVAFYTDDVYITSAQGQTTAYLDLDRVEILKGPQGTLFGRNATGGLVHNIIAKPRLGELGGYGQFTYARFNEMNVQGALNLPIGQKIAVRLSGTYSRIDDLWENIHRAGATGSAIIPSFSPNGTVLSPGGQDLGGSDSFAVRGQVLFEPVPEFTIRLTGAYSRSNMSVAPYSQEPTIAVVDSQDRVINELRVSPTETRLAIGPGGANYTGGVVIVPVINGVFHRPAAGGDFFGYIAPDPKSLTLSEDYALSDLNKVDAQVYAAHLDYDFGGAQLSSITSYQKYYKNVFLGDGSAASTLAFGDESHTESWSQEVRLSGKTDRLQWQAGIFYLNNKVDVLQGIIMPPGSALAYLTSIFAHFPAIADLGNQLNAQVHFTSESGSVFGQVEYQIADAWTIVGGARYIHEKQTDSYREFNAANLSAYHMSNIVTAPSFQPDYNNARSFNMWTGKLQLEYRPANGLLVYAGVNRGVKAGNYNAPFTFSPADVVPTAALGYAPEKLWSYEGGFKLNSGPLALAASAFYYDYKDFQAFVFTTASGVVRNVDSQVYGVDLDASYRVSHALRLGANFAYSHAEIKDFEVAPGILRDVRPPYSPRVQATGTIDYTVPGEIAGGDLSFNATVNYAGEIFHNIRNFDAQRFAPRTLVNLSMTWENPDGGLSVSIFGKNVFDERYGQIGFDNTTVFGGQNVSYGKPASYGGTVGFKF